jgi:hypothetical protein
VRKAGNRVRIIARLVDVAAGNHIWAERYDRESKRRNYTLRGLSSPANYANDLSFLVSDASWRLRPTSGYGQAHSAKRAREAPQIVTHFARY